MYNRVQQRFDKSIRDAIEHAKRVNDAKPRRRVVALPSEPETKPNGSITETNAGAEAPGAD